MKKLTKKLIRYDIKAGFLQNRVKILIFTIVCFLIGVIGAKDITSAEKITGVKASVVDYVCFFVGGPKHIPEGDLQIYVIPVLWLLLQVLIAYIIGYYAMTDLDTYGKQILIRSGSRKKWWTSKCIWNGFNVIIMYFIIYAIAILSAIINNAKISNKLTYEIVSEACDIDMINGGINTNLIILFLMPVIMSLAMSMLQMTIALIFSPIIGFIVSQSIVFLSTIYEKKWLFTNYGMLSHNYVTCGSAIVYKEGIVICAGIYMVSAIVGFVYFSRSNILPKHN